MCTMQSPATESGTIKEGVGTGSKCVGRRKFQVPCPPTVVPYVCTTVSCNKSGNYQGREGNWLCKRHGKQDVWNSFVSLPSSPPPPPPPPEWQQILKRCCGYVLKVMTNIETENIETMLWLRFINFYRAYNTTSINLIHIHNTYVTYFSSVIGICLVTCITVFFKN